MTKNYVKLIPVFLSIIHLTKMYDIYPIYKHIITILIISQTFVPSYQSRRIGPTNAYIIRIHAASIGLKQVYIVD